MKRESPHILNMDASKNKINKDSKKGNGEREKKIKLMVQQPVEETMEKNKRVQQLVGKEIHRLEFKRNKRNPHARKTIAIITL